MKIRQMKLADFDNLYALWKKAGLAISDIETEKNEAAIMIQLNKSSCLVAVKNGDVVGSIFGIFNGRRAWIYHLVIDPKYQKIGLGSQLLKKAEEALVKRGAHKIRLWIEFHNLAIFPFYQKNKYRVISDAVMVGKDFVP